MSGTVGDRVRGGALHGAQGDATRWQASLTHPVAHTSLVDEDAFARQGRFLVLAAQQNLCVVIHRFRILLAMLAVVDGSS